MYVAEPTVSFETLDVSLRDQLASGIRNEACQMRLPSKDYLTFSKEFKITLNTADRDAHQLRGVESRWSRKHPQGEAAGGQNLLQVQREKLQCKQLPFERDYIA